MGKKNGSKGVQIHETLGLCREILSQTCHNNKINVLPQLAAYSMLFKF
jgi:hypothetical protein